MEIDLGLEIERLGGDLMKKVFKVYQGESRPINIGITEGGVPFPIPDDAQILVAVKERQEDVFYQFAIQDAEITRLGPGIISITPTSAQTNLYPKEYKLQVSITRGNGVMKSVVGVLEILPCVIPYGAVGVGAAVLPALEAAGA